MLRFLLKKTYGSYDQPKKEDFYTIDIEVKELEDRLNSGGHDQYAFEFTDLIGVEVLKEASNEKA